MPGAIGHFLLLLMGVILFQIWFPDLVFLTPPDAPQEVVIRSLAGFAFHGVSSAYWILFCLSLGIGTIFGLFVLTSHPREFKSYVSKILTGEFLIQFLFYVFCMNPSSRPTSPRVMLDNIFIPASLLLLGGLSLLYGALWGIFRNREKHQQSRKADSPLPRVDYACPHCQRIFHAHVSYCPSCKKNIQLI